MSSLRWTSHSHESQGSRDTAGSRTSTPSRSPSRLTYQGPTTSPQGNLGWMASCGSGWRAWVTRRPGHRQAEDRKAGNSVRPAPGPSWRVSCPGRPSTAHRHQQTACFLYSHVPAPSLLPNSAQPCLPPGPRLATPPLAKMTLCSLSWCLTRDAGGQSGFRPAAWPRTARREPGVSDSLKAARTAANSCS